jgi:hypothetical protein
MGHASKRWNLTPLFAMGMAAAAALVLLVAQPKAPTGTFSARGGPLAPNKERALGFEAHAHRGGAGQVPVLLRTGDALGPSDGLSFTIYNRTRAAQELLLFAVDASLEVHWFYPAYEDERSNPSSVTLKEAPEVTQLPEGVVMERPAQGSLQVVALFVPKKTQVKDVETALTGQGVQGLAKAFPGATLQALDVVVR